MSKGFRVSVLGGGSAYTPGLVQGFIRQSKQVPLSQLVLMDIDEAKLNIVGAVVKSMLKNELPQCKLVLTTNREQAIKHMDFIICQIRAGGLEARHIDESIPVKYGVIGQETTGPGGFCMALRTIPVMMEIAAEIEQKNPRAWLINYTNPTGLVAEAISKTSSIKHISICDEPMVVQESLAAFLKVPPEQLFFDYFGLNHLAWARQVFLKGVDILPQLRETLQDIPLQKLEPLFGDEILRDPKVRTELRNTLRIFKQTGMMPSPYLQYYWFTDEICKHQSESELTRAEQVINMEEDILDDYIKAARGQKHFEVLRGGKWHADMMVGMFGAIANDTRQVFIANVPNHGALPELPYEKIVEVPALVDARGAHPLAMGKMPTQVRGLIQAVSAYEELTVSAVIKECYDTALAALACHPLVPSRDIAKSIFEDYLKAHKESLAYLSKP